MISIPIKRTWESLLFTFPCVGILDSGETVTAVSQVISDSGMFTIGTPSINTIAFNLPDGTAIGIGQAIQARISGGTIPSSAKFFKDTFRARFTTSEGNSREATGYLILSDDPSQQAY